MADLTLFASSALLEITQDLTFFFPFSLLQCVCVCVTAYAIGASCTVYFLHLFYKIKQKEIYIIRNIHLQILIKIMLIKYIL